MEKRREERGEFFRKRDNTPSQIHSRCERGGGFLFAPSFFAEGDASLFCTCSVRSSGSSSRVRPPTREKNRSRDRGNERQAIGEALPCSQALSFASLLAFVSPLGHEQPERSLSRRVRSEKEHRVRISGNRRRHDDRPPLLCTSSSLLSLSTQPCLRFAAWTRKPTTISKPKRWPS